MMFKICSGLDTVAVELFIYGVHCTSKQSIYLESERMPEQNVISAHSVK